MKVNGSCHCGEITYEADVDPAQVNLCNCVDCQVFSGSAFRVSVPVPAASFRLLNGRPRTYVKTAESGRKRRQAFCATCGSPICASDDSDSPSSYMLRIGGLAQRAQLPPKKRIWCKSALPWVQELNAVPGIDGQ